MVHSSGIHFPVASQKGAMAPVLSTIGVSDAPNSVPAFAKTAWLTAVCPVCARSRAAAKSYDTPEATVAMSRHRCAHQTVKN